MLSALVLLCSHAIHTPQVRYSVNRFIKFVGPGLLMSIAYVVSGGRVWVCVLGIPQHEQGEQQLQRPGS